MPSRIGAERVLVLAISARRSAVPRVLVVDDDELVRVVVVAVLKEAGYDVESARNGEEALQVIAGRTPFHMVLLDVQMPVLDGWAMIRELRARGDATPVVMMSAHATESEAIKGGAKALLAKPFDRALLVDTVSRWAAPALDAAAG